MLPTEINASTLQPFFMKLNRVHDIPMVTSYTYEQLQHSEDPVLREQANNIMELQSFAIPAIKQDTINF